MTSQSIFAEIAVLSGDPSRVSMLHALMDGRALTATELARAAGITPQFASSHLVRMTAVACSRSRSRGVTAIIASRRRVGSLRDRKHHAGRCRPQA